MIYESHLRSVGHFVCVPMYQIKTGQSIVLTTYLLLLLDISEHTRFSENASIKDCSHICLRISGIHSSRPTEIKQRCKCSPILYFDMTNTILIDLINPAIPHCNTWVLGLPMACHPIARTLELHLVLIYNLLQGCSPSLHSVFTYVLHSETNGSWTLWYIRVYNYVNDNSL